MSVEPPRKKIKAGGNWKKLQKTLVSDDRPRRVSSSSSSRIDKGKSRVQDSADTRDSSSPAPTTLPWFAEDLSPEDLALVRKSSSRSSLREGTSGSGSAAGVGRHGAETGTQQEEDVDLYKKKRAILGGDDLSEEKKEPGTYVAIDCEMVGVGPEGSESVLARVSIVNWHGAVLLDSFVQPQEKVTDYRTWVSGVRPQDLQSAPSFQHVQSQVAKLIKGRVLVGHAIHNDLKALLLSHPKPLIRDTAQNKLCRELANSKYPSLKKLVNLRLGIDIQKSGSEHSSVEDARATMALYRTLHSEWQKSMTSPSTAILAKGWKKKRSSEGGEGDHRSSDAKKAIKPTKATKTAAAQDPEWWKQV